MNNLKNTLLAIAASLVATSAAAGVYFEDNFDGSELSADWTIVNEDPETYLVEDGVLTLLVPDHTSAWFGEAPNTLVLNKPIPKGDWKMTVRLIFTPQTLGEIFQAGVAKDKDNGLFSIFDMYTRNYVSTDANLTGKKVAKGKQTSFSRTLYTISSRNLEARASVFPDNIAAVELQLEKKKHNYIARMRLEPVNPGTKGAPDGKWREVQKLTSLRKPGDKFFMTFGSWSTDYLPHDGEALMAVDWVRIETP